MPLTFPTLAEQALAEFRSATKTISLATICKRRGAEKFFQYPVTIWTFEDDTSVEVYGSGKAHKAVARLP